ncbi:MAG: radical SAM protein [Candidatus Aenigmatarchaeota archaeon]
MENGSILYNPLSFRFYYLDKSQTEKFLKENKKVKVLTPKVSNPFILCFFDLTYKCNLKCIHCHNAYENIRELTYEQKLNALNQIFDLGVLHISFGGGEPTLYEHLLDILKYTSRHTTCSFVTNGTLLDKEFCKKLRGLVSYVGVSLDGFRETHAKIRNADIFDKVIESIQMLIRYKIPVRVTTTPTKINYKELPALGRFVLKDLKVSAWKIMKYIPEGGKGLELALTDEEEKWLYTQINKLSKEKIDYYLCIKCPAGKSVFSVYANGDVSPCGFAPFMISGNLLKTPLVEILQNGTFFKLMRIVKSNKCISANFWRENKFYKTPGW